MTDLQAARRTIQFLVDQGVTTVFLQIPDGPEARRALGEGVIDRERLPDLLALLNSVNIRVCALDGAPRFVEPAYHDGVVQTVRNVAAYNDAVAENKRFYGVRYDIESYLLPGFHGPGRTRILTELLTLTERIVVEVHQANLRVGLDIPFWYDAPSERTFKNVALEWKGRVQPAFELSRYSSFAGFSIHDVRSWAALVEARTRGTIRPQRLTASRVLVEARAVPALDLSLDVLSCVSHALEFAAGKHGRLVVVMR